MFFCEFFLNPRQLTRCLKAFSSEQGYKKQRGPRTKLPSSSPSHGPLLSSARSRRGSSSTWGPRTSKRPSTVWGPSSCKQNREVIKQNLEPLKTAFLFTVFFTFFLLLFLIPISRRSDKLSFPWHSEDGIMLSVLLQIPCVDDSSLHV